MYLLSALIHGLGFDGNNFRSVAASFRNLNRREKLISGVMTS